MRVHSDIAGGPVFVTEECVLNGILYVYGVPLSRHAAALRNVIEVIVASNTIQGSFAQVVMSNPCQQVKKHICSVVF